jgi:hypothetical protein
MNKEFQSKLEKFTEIYKILVHEEFIWGLFWFENHFLDFLAGAFFAGAAFLAGADFPFPLFGFSSYSSSY